MMMYTKEFLKRLIDVVEAEQRCFEPDDWPQFTQLIRDAKVMMRGPSDRYHPDPDGVRPHPSEEA